MKEAFELLQQYEEAESMIEEATARRNRCLEELQKLFRDTGKQEKMFRLLRAVGLTNGFKQVKQAKTAPQVASDVIKTRGKQAKPKTQTIKDYVRANPGKTAGEIIKATGLDRSVRAITSNLTKEGFFERDTKGRLYLKTDDPEKAEKNKKERVGRSPQTDPLHGELMILGALSTEVTKSQKQICDRTGMCKSTVSHKVHAMRRRGLLSRDATLRWLKTAAGVALEEELNVSGDLGLVPGSAASSTTSPTT